MSKSERGKAKKTGTGRGGEWNPPLVWNKKIPNTELDKFKKIVEKKYNLHFDSYWDVHKWSIENYEKFWEEVWKYFDIIASKPYDQVVVKKGDCILDYDWFPGAAFNFAENLLRIRDDRIAIGYIDETGYEETITYAQMFEEVKLYAAAFRKHGLKIGDRVACYMSNRKEAIFTFLAATSIGAIFGAAQPFLAAKASSNIIGVMDAKFLIVVDYHKGWGEDISLLDNLPVILEKSSTLEKVIIIATKKETLTNGIKRIRNGYSLEEFLRSGRRADGSVPDIIFEQLPASHPICINFTSGTTGISKGPMHSAVTLLSSLVSLVFHHNLTSEDIFLTPCPAGWVIWDFYIPCLAVGVNLFLYCGVPYHIRDGVNIWDIMAKHKVTSTNLVTSVVDRMEKLEIVPGPKSNLENLKSVFIIGSPVKVNNIQYILNKVQKNAFVASLYVKTGDGFLDYDWFRGAKFNLAENLLRIRDDRNALICLDESGYEEIITYAEVFEEAKLYSAAFRKNGLKKGDTVACHMSNRKEAIYAMLATTSIGAIWGGPQPYFGARVASNIIARMEPKFLITVDHHQDNGVDFNILENLPIIVDNCPTLEKVIIIPSKKETVNRGISDIRNSIFLEEFLESGRNPDGSVPEIEFEQLPFSHPAFLNFTSGTTGLPKGLVHSAGMLIPEFEDIAFKYNLKSGDVVFNWCPVGWSVWDCFLPCLALGITVFLYCGSPYWIRDGINMWDLIAKYKAKYCFFVPSMLDKLEKLQIVPSPHSNLENLKVVLIGGSPVKVQNLTFVQNKVGKHIFVAILYGATETFGCFTGVDMNLPLYAGEVQVPALGMDIRVVDENGRSLIGEKGEIIFATPCPSFPVYLWKDVDHTIMKETYLSKYPGAWCQHDEGWINPETRGLIVLGRR